MTVHFHIDVSDFQAEGNAIADSALDEQKLLALRAIKFCTFYDAREALAELVEKCDPFNNALVWKTEDNPEGAVLLDLLDFDCHYLIELFVVEDLIVGNCPICEDIAQFSFKPMALEEICAAGMWYDESVEERNVPQRKEQDGAQL